MLFWRPVSAFIIVMLLHHGVRYAISFIPVLYEKYLGVPYRHWGSGAGCRWKWERCASGHWH